MNELEQRLERARHEYAIYVDWLHEERKEEFDRLINAVKAEAPREAADFLRGDMDEPHGYRAGARLDLRASETARADHV